MVLTTPEELIDRLAQRIHVAGEPVERAELLARQRLQIIAECIYSALSDAAPEIDDSVHSVGYLDGWQAAADAVLEMFKGGA